MYIKCKKIIVLTLLLSLMNIFLIGTTQKVQANSISPFAYYDPNPISFYGTYRGVSNYYDGTHMGVEVRATASDGISRQITIEVYIASTNTTKKYSTHSDGVNRKADQIPIGNGSRVVISAYCIDSSVRIDLDLKMYSWQ